MERHLADINVRRLLIVGAIGVILLVEIILLTEAGYYYALEQQRQTRWAESTWDVEKLEDRQKARLEGYSWIDREKGLVTIPIDKAMAIVAERRQGRSSTTRPTTQP